MIDDITVEELKQKIDAGEQMRQQAARKIRDQQMRRLHLAVRPGDGARLDRIEREIAV